MAKFQPGQSGNPAGRRPGSGKVAVLRKKIERDVPAIIETLVQAARAGDTSAAKLLLDRALPPLKPQDSPVQLPLGQNLAQAGQAILEAVGGGKITPDQGARLLQGLHHQAGLAEHDELRRRIETLEETMQ